nr:glucose-methanol-choline oxidoreductase, FAD/NAD(P)-binding domain protein [Tanacetum cinerariifolium]
MKALITLKLSTWGEFWVLLKFASEESKKLFHENVGVGTWFSQLQQTSMDFTIDGRITWVEIKEVLGWVPDLMKDNEEDYDSDGDSNEGDLKGEDVGLKSCSILGEDSDDEEVFETKFEEGFHTSSFTPSDDMEEQHKKNDESEKERDTWKEAHVKESNAVANMMKKLKYLKQKIREWHNENKKSAQNSRSSFKKELVNLDKIIDNGEGMFKIKAMKDELLPLGKKP